MPRRESRMFSPPRMHPRVPSEPNGQSQLPLLVPRTTWTVQAPHCPRNFEGAARLAGRHFKLPAEDDKKKELEKLILNSLLSHKYKYKSKNKKATLFVSFTNLKSALMVLKSCKFWKAIHTNILGVQCSTFSISGLKMKIIITKITHIFSGAQSQKKQEEKHPLSVVSRSYNYHGLCYISQLDSRAFAAKEDAGKRDVPLPKVELDQMS